jgi:hypothetical protein
MREEEGAAASAILKLETKARKDPIVTLRIYGPPKILVNGSEKKNGARSGDVARTVEIL